MATVINNPGGPDRVIERDNGTSAVWAIAIVLIALILIGLFIWPGLHRVTPGVPNTGTTGGTNVNLTVPGNSGSGVSTGATGGSTGGTGAGTSASGGASGSVSGSASGAASGGTQ